MISILTFNMLCPAYKRCTGGDPAAASVAAAALPAVSVAPPPAAASSSSSSAAAAASATASAPPAAVASSAAPSPSLPVSSPHADSSSSPGLFPFSAAPRGRYREGERDCEWSSRLRSIAAALIECNADIVVLQEFWCTSPKFLSLFDSLLGHLYLTLVCPRTGGKDDGLAVLMRKGGGGRVRVESEGDWTFALTGCGNRVGFLVKLRATVEGNSGDDAREAGQKQPNQQQQPAPGAQASHSWAWRHAMPAAAAAAASAAASPSSSAASPSAASSASSAAGSYSFSFLLLATHLTFPHGFSDRQMRKLEINHLLTSLDEVVLNGGLKKDKQKKGKFPFCAAGALSPSSSSSEAPNELLSGLDVVLLGDFNTDPPCQKDSVYRRAVSHGFCSTYASLHEQKEAGVTHRNHRGEEVCVDFVFLKGGGGGAGKIARPAAAPQEPSSSASPPLSSENGGAQEHRGADARQSRLQAR